MICLFTRLIIVLISCSVVAWSQEPWQAIGPQGGNFRPLVIDPFSSEVVYTISEGAVVFKSIDTGKTWNMLSRPPIAGAIFSGNSLVSDPKNSGVLYLSRNGVFKSVDGGNSWQSFSNGIPGNATVISLTIDRTSNRVLYAGTSDGRGLYKTIDAAVSWQRSDTGLPANRWIRFIAIHPLDNNIIFAGIGDGVGGPGGIYRSTNAGATWEPLDDPLASYTIEAIVIDPTNPSTLYVGSRRGLPLFEVQKSIDDGKNWRVVHADESSLTSLVIDPQNSAILFAGYLSRLWRSTDYGETWNAVLERPFAYSITVDPNDSQIMFVAGNLGVFRSTNGGDTWATVNEGLNALSVTSLALDTTMPSTVYASSNSATAVFKTEDHGETWAPTNNGLPFTVTQLLIDPFASSSLYGVTQSTQQDAVYKTIDAAASWQSSGNGLPSAQISQLAADWLTPQTVYASTLRAIYRTNNAGMSWQDAGSIGLPNVFVSTVTVNLGDSNILHAGIVGGGINERGFYKSDNAGATWRRVNLGLWNGPVDVIVPDPVDPNTLYAGTGNNSVADSGVYRSTDAGETWLPTGLSHPLVLSVAVDPITPTTLYAGTARSPQSVTNNLYKSSDSGKTWRGLGFGGFTIRSIVINPEYPDIVYVSTDGGSVFRTLTGGE